MDKKFILTDAEAELLLEFENAPSLELLASQVGRDITVVSRQLKRISEKADLLIKVSGRWCLSEKGRRFNQATQDFIRSQEGILSQKYHLRIGTNREFASRCLGPNIKSLQVDFENANLEIRAYSQGTEQALLLGEIDIAFDCGRPQSPDIKYSQLKKELILAVASPDFVKKHGKVKKLSDFLVLPHIYCERLRPDRVASIPWDSSNMCVSTNDIASARAMALQGVGWALLPAYAIEPELKRKELISIYENGFDQEKYGVWRLRTRPHLEKDYVVACEWLKKLNF